jgi:D-alanyl-D-alanine carboxypeptidase (penicillin-binding protein 5/6)
MRWLIGLWCLCHAGFGLAQADPFPKIAGAYWLEIDGTPVWSKRAQERLPPASLTKMMTALLVLERISASPTTPATVRVSAAAAAETGTRIGLQAGELLKLSDLLAATLVASANDACHALVDHLEGSQQRFVQHMNQRAQQLGLRNTRFMNACGHDAPQHYSSAHDLAMLAHALLQHPRALELAGTSQQMVQTTDGSRSFTLTNTNALIGRYPGAIGLKTGRTPGAGNCLVAVARRGDVQVLLVLLHGANRWWDTVDVLDLAFERAQRQP